MLVVIIWSSTSASNLQWRFNFSPDGISVFQHFLNLRWRKSFSCFMSESEIIQFTLFPSVLTPVLDVCLAFNWCYPGTRLHGGGVRFLFVLDRWIGQTPPPPLVVSSDWKRDKLDIWPVSNPVAFLLITPSKPINFKWEWMRKHTVCIDASTPGNVSGSASFLLLFSHLKHSMDSFHSHMPKLYFGKKQKKKRSMKET